MIIFGEPTGEILIFSFFQMELVLGNWIFNDSWVNSIMEFPCELWGEFFGEKIGIREIFFYRVFLLQKPKDLEIARGQNLFFRCTFFNLNVFERKWGSVSLGGLFSNNG